MSLQPVDDFVPPYPERHLTRPTLVQAIRLFRRSMLDVWMKGHFSEDLFQTKILKRRVFVCNSPDTVRQAFVEQAEIMERKTPQMRYALEPLLGDGLFISEGEMWRRRRRAVAPVTHASRMHELAPVMTEVAAEWAARWQALPEGTDIDALEEMAQMTAEVICRTLFGRALGSAAAETVVHAFSTYQARIGQTALGAMLNLPDWLPRLQSFSTRREARRIHAVLDKLIATVLEAPPDAGEASLVRAMTALQSMEPWALRNEAATLFMAGHETTANTLAWAWYLLSQSPAAAARLAAEAQTVLAGRTATLADVDALPYARAVIEETLRLYPPVPMLGREALRDTTLRDRFVPQGSLVLVVPWLLHRNPKLWDMPDHFRPERFLESAPPRYGYVPFSIGPRVCTGQQFGMVETVICLATLAQGTALRLRPGHVVRPVSRLTLRPGDGLPMTVHPA
ncbi:cytochrome P450 [Rhodovarius lipocyclicus]|uniref:cytochrome P450 n=1 Tax=Rhodovarius lipocyclicus TaxID=268410 RepID=UPI00135C3195|nr:cytochrome P450 [Rhodovarius lipocyclicus]